MKKIFISCPMRDKTDEEIEEKRKLIKERLEKRYGEISIIDSFFKDAPQEATPFWYLGQSILKLSEADIAVFCDGWKKYDGCYIEHETAKRYSTKPGISLSILYEKDL